MDEGHRANARLRPRARTVRAQVALDLIEEDTQSVVERLAVMLEVIA